MFVSVVFIESFSTGHLSMYAAKKDIRPACLERTAFEIDRDSDYNGR